MASETLVSATFEDSSIRLHSQPAQCARNHDAVKVNNLVRNAQEKIFKLKIEGVFCTLTLFTQRHNPYNFYRHKLSVKARSFYYFFKWSSLSAATSTIHGLHKT